MSEYIFDRQGLAADASIDLHDYLKVREVVNSRIKEQIVRCKDCKRSYVARIGGEERLLCSERRGYCKKDGFCAWGEKA